METFATIASLILMMLGIPIALLMVRDRIEGSRSNARWEQMLREHPEEVPGTPEYLARLDRPQFEQLESRLGCRLPDSYRALYCEKKLSHESNIALFPPDSEDVSDCWEIQEFLPADEGAFEYWGEYLGSKSLPFAADGAGDVYFITLDAGTIADAPVWKFFHDGGDKIDVVGSLAEFLTWRRVPLDQIEYPDD
jgi:hypothetical protein